MTGLEPPTPRRPRIRDYVISFAVGLLAGLIFWLLRTPSPVPPIFGLVGLLGIAFGEIGTKQLLELGKARRNRKRSADG